MHSDSLPPYMSYEIIIPRRLEPERGKAKKDGLSYIIKAAGKEHIIRLKRRNNFLIGNLPVFTYDSEGRKVKNSLVALSTCFGLRGFIKLRGLHYGLEPLGGSRLFQHFLYLTNKTGFNSTVCGLGADGPNHQAEEAGRGRPNVRFANDLLYIELYVVVDNMMFRYEGRNETRVIYIVLDTINMVYTHYRFLNIAVILVGLDIWKERNPIEISRDTTNLTHDLSEWKIAHAKEVQRDTTHLFVHQRFDAVPWHFYLGGICSPDLSVGIDPYLTRDLQEFSNIISHTLGHNLGLGHDGPYCFCDEQTSCIMHPSHTTFALFSNCSIASLSRLRMGKKLGCLHNAPDPTSLFKFKHCGNKVVDEGEQCDCGGEQQCRWDPCCNPNCTFKGKAICTHEDCCKDCQFTRRGALWESRWCPADVYKQDGTPCDKNAYCYANKCSAHSFQCADIFGEEARTAPWHCFKALNMAGDELGNCGSDGEGETFVKCKEEDVLCGRLHCTNVRRQLNLLTYTQSLVNGVSCWSTKYQRRRGTEDKGAVPDGTVCDSNKICMNRTCVPISILKSACDPMEKCHGRGVCNNRDNCHCHRGWAPPFCTHFGSGGSIDGGSPQHAFTALFFSFAFKVVVPVLVVGVAVFTLLSSRLRLLLNRCRQRISCWR
ncbi:PREDICTED: disintegrin and metalloproteinase domain-containing protein 21-like [Gekko japonicus]|uniref:Disintegrin and metalloproteinase domain-containing protein 21-like n=1 Tax=Gekko japonicus TaxID=146911 RepID=A0ABM1K4R5_GEKJA|nr:PREDICTED: disintegrin and metalloproteinase domain-containing protein 21-like [Gekko japonicus]